MQSWILLEKGGKEQREAERKMSMGRREGVRMGGRREGSASVDMDIIIIITSY